jgi:glycosyltransferase involved in cell wall biosynthesis
MQNVGHPRVVIAHDFTEMYGGAERIVAAIAEALPQAPVWSILGRRSVAERMGVGDRSHTVLPEREWLLRHYRRLAPLYPAVVHARRLPEADVLLTSSYAFVHGFQTRNRAPQVCYCYSPLRFAWSMTSGYKGRVAGDGVRGAVFRALAATMRAADRRAAARVTTYVAESHYIADQIERYYGREAEVVHPPVDCELFKPDGRQERGDYYLFCGRLVEPYKRPGMVVDAFRGLPERLVIAGDGPAYAELKSRAPANVEFVGHLDDDELVPLMQHCAATVFPSVDDFGLIPVESMACGRPVLAFAAGGALETVEPGATGELFEQQSVDALREAIRRFDPDAYDPIAIRKHAEGWSLPRFQRRIVEIVERTADRP